MQSQLISLLLGIFSSTPTCQWNAPPQILFQGQHELHQVWELDNSRELWDPADPSRPLLSGFRTQIESRIPDLDARSIIRRMYLEFLASGDPAYLDEAVNPRLAFEGIAGAIRPISCLEALLVEVQLQRQSMIEHPTEFGALILRSPTDAKLRIYYSTQDVMGLRGIHPEIKERLDSDLSSEWVLWTHLHNHPFDFSNQVNFLGAPVPSLSDVHAYRSQKEELGLQSARVTNGFDTIEISAEEFYRFRAHGDLTVNAHTPAQR